MTAHNAATRLILGGLGGACALMSLNMIFRPAAAVRMPAERVVMARLLACLYCTSDGWNGCV